MTYATVMVSLALDQSNEARLQVAGELAERFEAGIIGVAAAQFAPPLYFTDGAAGAGLIDRGRSLRQATPRRARGAIPRRDQEPRRTCGMAQRHGFSGALRSAQARCADIIVSGGQSPAFSDAFALASPKDLVMQAGRPLLVVPDGVNWLDLRSVLVAWKDTPEARRAVADALPMLRKAKDVTVAAIPEGDDDRACRDGAA